MSSRHVKFNKPHIYNVGSSNNNVEARRSNTSGISELNETNANLHQYNTTAAAVRRKEILQSLKKRKGNSAYYMNNTSSKRSSVNRGNNSNGFKSNPFFGRRGKSHTPGTSHKQGTSPSRKTMKNRSRNRTNPVVTSNPLYGKRMNARRPILSFNENGVFTANPVHRMGSTAVESNI